MEANVGILHSLTLSCLIEDNLGTSSNASERTREVQLHKIIIFILADCISFSVLLILQSAISHACRLPVCFVIISIFQGHHFIYFIPSWARNSSPRSINRSASVSGYLHGQEVFSPAPAKLARVRAIAPHGPRGARAVGSHRRLEHHDHGGHGSGRKGRRLGERGSAAGLPAGSSRLSLFAGPPVGEGERGGPPPLAPAERRPKWGISHLILARWHGDSIGCSCSK